ncbi:MAG: hypothetical protein RI973_78 [Bacteroidota bacterium]
MKQSFTQTDLLRFIYRETPALESMAIAEALKENPLLREEYEELCEGYLELPKAKFNAKPSTLQRILRYSQETTLNPAH